MAEALWARRYGKVEMQDDQSGSRMAEMHAVGGHPVCISGPSEPQSHTEHQAALEATLFRSVPDPHEVVLELDSGKLRLRQS